MKEDIDKLVLDNIPLISKVIKDLRCYWRSEDEREEIYYYGLMGLIKGTKVYDYSVKPSSFLYPCISNEIKHYMRLSNMDKRKIHKETMVSIYKEVGEKRDTELIEFFEDENINVEQELMDKLEVEKIMYAMNKVLTKKQKMYLCQYYGVYGYKPMAFNEMARKYNCSRQNIKQTIEWAKRKIKDYLKRYKKEAYISIKSETSFEEDLKEVLGFKE